MAANVAAAQGGSFPPTVFPPLQWYAAYTRPQHERAVERHLLGRGLETFCPAYRAERLLLPGYVLVHCDVNHRQPVVTVPGLLHLVSIPGYGPLPIPQHEIDALRLAVEHATVQPHPFLSVGDRVTIVRGPLAGVTGILVREGHGTQVVISIEMLARSMAVTIDSSCLRPAA